MSNKRKKKQLPSQRLKKAKEKSGQSRSEKAIARVREREAMIADGRIVFADPSKQAPNNSYGPPTEYRDHEFTCCDCGIVETWTAKQQQWWYEVAKGNVNSRATRCRKCRAKHRKYKGLAPRTIAEREAREQDQGEQHSS